MRGLPIPNFDTERVVIECMSGSADTAMQIRILDGLAVFKHAEARFKSASSSHTVHLLPVAAFALPGVKASDLAEELYSRGMVNRRAGRRLYDALMLVPTHGRCPLCGVGRVMTLDHHLPKTKFPLLCVTPLNLVPACRDCNSAKLQGSPTTVGEQTINPYFDRLSSGQWLHARICGGVPPVLEFFVEPPGHWEPLMAMRLRNHVDVFELLDRFSKEMASIIPDLRFRLRNLLCAGDPAEVSSYLTSEADTRLARDGNSYQGVAYKALAADRWFCGGGFELFM